MLGPVTDIEHSQPREENSEEHRTKRIWYRSLSSGNKRPNTNTGLRLLSELSTGKAMETLADVRIRSCPENDTKIVASRNRENVRDDVLQDKLGNSKTLQR